MVADNDNRPDLTLLEKLRLSAGKPARDARR